jgi:hypothetical protein
VTPPSAAERDSVRKSVSGEPNPKCTCGSITPGMIHWPRQSTVSSAGASSPAARIATMRPSRTPTDPGTQPKSARISSPSRNRRSSFMDGNCRFNMY